MEDVQLIKLDIDVDRIVTNTFVTRPVRSIGQSSVLTERYMQTKVKRAWLIVTMVVLDYNFQIT